jgi:hypothetical protein
MDSDMIQNSLVTCAEQDRLRGVVARVPDYRSRDPVSILGATRLSEE